MRMDATTKEYSSKFNLFDHIFRSNIDKFRLSYSLFTYMNTQIYGKELYTPLLPNNAGLDFSKT